VDGLGGSLAEGKAGKAWAGVRLSCGHREGWRLSHVCLQCRGLQRACALVERRFFCPLACGDGASREAER